MFIGLSGELQNQRQQKNFDVAFFGFGLITKSDRQFIGFMSFCCHGK